MNTLFANDQGGITYASQQQAAGQPEQRTEILSDVRQLVDCLTETCESIRKHWPAHIPMPQDLKAMLCYQDFALARVRGGSLKRFAEACGE